MDDDAASPIVRSLILRLLLVPVKDQREIFKLVSLINKSQTADRCRWVQFRTRRRLVMTADILKRIETSQSLQDRYVLMLYWLVRRKGACDFSYRNLTADRRKLMLAKV